MTETPKLLLLKRQTLAHLGGAKVGLDYLAVSSGSTAAASTLAPLIAGTKIALVLPIIASFITGVALLGRILLSYYIGIAKVSNPIPGETTPPS